MNKTITQIFVPANDNRKNANIWNDREKLKLIISRILKGEIEW